MIARREGFTITEVVISMVLLAIVLTTLAGLTYATAQRALISTTSAARQAYALEQVNRWVALPYASIPASGTTCDVVGTTNNEYRRCIKSVTSGSAKTVTISVKPLSRSVDSMVFTLVRAAPSPVNPLCTTC